MSQAFLDEVRHQSLRSLLVVHQNVVRRGDLVALKAIQQCNANHSRWKGGKKAMTIITKVGKSLPLMLVEIRSNLKAQCVRSRYI